MQKSKVAFLAVLAVVLTVPVYATVAFAETGDDADLKGAFGEVLEDVGTMSGEGMAAGALMTILRVAGKRITKEDSPFNVAKLLITLGIGAAVGIVLQFAGIPAGAAFGIDFVAIYFVNQILRPIFTDWELKSKKTK